MLTLFFCLIEHGGNCSIRVVILSQQVLSGQLLSSSYQLNPTNFFTLSYKTYRIDRIAPGQSLIRVSSSENDKKVQQPANPKMRKRSFLRPFKFLLSTHGGPFQLERLFDIDDHMSMESYDILKAFRVQ